MIVSVAMSETTSVGQVLGASTSLAGGIAFLPGTGGGIVPKILPLMAITLGTISLLSFITTRLIKKVL